MDIFRKLNTFPGVSQAVITIGTFDGVHKGHQKLISRVVSEAKRLNTKSGLITFDPHPQHVVKSRESDKKKLLTPIDEKAGLIAEYDLDFLWILPFTKEVSQISAYDFLKQFIIAKCQPQKIIIGHDHRFGRNREGDDNFLKNYSAAYGYELEVVPPVADRGEVISSSLIRQLIIDKKLQKAISFLGHPFSISGVVVTGDRRGKVLAFPTANIEPLEPDQLLPPVGVYCVHVRIDGRGQKGMCNIGYRPTFKDNRDEPLIEVHIFKDDIGHLYGKHIQITFDRFIRDEIKFSSPEELVKQLNYDRKNCLNLTKT